MYFPKLCLTFLLFLLCTSFLPARAQPGFVSPIAGTHGKEWIIVNYVDWDTATTFKDLYCITKTYDGHQGTDFTIRDFKAMDSGVDVRAAGNGRVIFVKDGLFDREKGGVVSKGLGNYIGITHAGRFQTYYGHLRKNSVLVQVGDSVVAGQKIALVGSSGNSETPHLHFELWSDSTYYIDPFQGPCGNGSSYFASPPAYDSGWKSWAVGMLPFAPGLDTLKEGLPSRDTFYSNDAAISYWNLQWGVRAGDSLRIDWLDPTGNLWYREGYKTVRDWWYYYFSGYINVPASGASGRWEARYFRNGILENSRPFYFLNRPSGVAGGGSLPAGKMAVSYSETEIFISGVGSASLKIYDLQGREIATLPAGKMRFPKTDFPPGLYLVMAPDAAGRKQVAKMVVAY